jgi:hypothetical protein
MAQFGRSNVYDALTNKPRDRIAVVKGADGELERRIIKRPEGRMVEEFVDPAGNIVWIQTLQFGTNHTTKDMDSKRAELRRDGFVEYAKCPLRTGAHTFTAQLEGEFSMLPDKLARPCSQDPVVYERKGARTHLHEPCAHVLFLIEQRRAAHAEAQKLRASHIETQVDVSKQQVALTQQQLEQQTVFNQRLLELLEKHEKGSKKG